MTTSDTEGAQIDLRIYNAKVGWGHIESEYLDVVDDILDTLVPEGPYAYTVAPAPTGDGSIPHQEFASTAAELREAYENLHRFSAVRNMEPVTEIRGDWYLFVYGLGEGLMKESGQVFHAPNAVLFPTMGKSGITGELFWMRSGMGAPYTGSLSGPLASELAITDRHDAFLDGMRKEDVEAVTALFHPNAQIGIRDHVADTGALAGLHSAAELRTHLTQFFARFRIMDVSLVHRYASDWFVFAELLWIVEHRQDPSRREKFYTAAHAEVHPDGLFASMIGHGTDREAL